MTEEEQLKKCKIFKELDFSDIQKVLKCASAREQSYPKGAFILREGNKAGSVGLLVQGEVSIIFEDFWGNRALVAKMYPGEIFGDAYVYSSDRTVRINVLATADCEAVMLDYERLIAPCDCICSAHRQILKNMLQIFSDKLRAMMRKMTFVSKRTLREKIMAYLSAAAETSRGDTVTITLSRQELADYLYVDRSALSRELSNMKREGLIDFSANRFRLISAGRYKD